MSFPRGDETSSGETHASSVGSQHADILDILTSMQTALVRIDNRLTSLEKSSADNTQATSAKTFVKSTSAPTIPEASTAMKRVEQPRVSMSSAQPAGRVNAGTSHTDAHDRAFVTPSSRNSTQRVLERERALSSKDQRVYDTLRRDAVESHFDAKEAVLQRVTADKEYDRLHRSREQHADYLSRCNSFVGQHRFFYTFPYEDCFQDARAAREYRRDSVASACRTAESARATFLGFCDAHGLDIFRYRLEQCKPGYPHHGSHPP